MKSENMNHISISLGILTLLAASATAGEFFVSPTGDDMADGATRSAAFATIGKGVDVLQPGDTLTILPGEYFESVNPKVAGTADAPITIRAERPGTVLMRGDVDVSGFEPAPGLRGVFVTKFDQRVESVAERSTGRTCVPKLSPAEVELELATYYHNAEDGFLYIHSSDSRSPDLHRLVVSVTNGCGLAFVEEGAGHHVIVDGLSFTGYSHRDYQTMHGSRTRWGIMFRNAKNATVRNCTAFLNSGGIHFLGGGEGCVVEDCYAFANNSRYVDIGNNILGWAVNEITFRDNRAEGLLPNLSRDKTERSKSDITVYSGGPDAVVENNLVINGGVMIKGGFENAVQRRNVVVGWMFYADHDKTNLEFYDKPHDSNFARANYADPLKHDYRPQSDSELRTKGPFPWLDDVYFVSPQGDDTAYGTSVELAWRTLTHAAQKTEPGDTVYVMSGEYAESLAPAHSGTAEKPIRFLRHGHDRVVLVGASNLEVGIDLRHRQHVLVRGFEVRGFAKHGVRVEGGGQIALERITVSESGEGGVLVSECNEFRLSHNLIRGNKGLRMEHSPNATLLGNVFDSEAPLTVDGASRIGLWSDHNNFVPSAPAEFALAAWQKQTGLDPNSISRKPGYEPGVWTLAANSPLIGAGPHASVIGPFLKLNTPSARPADDLRARVVTDTTATFDWWVQGGSAKAFLEWGETPECENRIELPEAYYHTASVTGLKPGGDYYYRVRTDAKGRQTVYSISKPEVPSPSLDESTALKFQTDPAGAGPREFHVATNGSDSNDGLSAKSPFRSIAHAALQVRAGDTVTVHAGVYDEPVRVRATGDADAPITFRAAPGEKVWITGSERKRSTAFNLTAVHHIIIDGFRFRDFGYPGRRVIEIQGGSNHTVRRCFYDGRAISGYTTVFIGGERSHDLLVENCVIIGGMGEGITLGRSANLTVRHCVFYLNNIRAMTVTCWDPETTFTLSHNLFCANLTQKTRVPLIRLMDLENLRADHNGFFTRIGPDDRQLLEVFNIGGKGVWIDKPGGRKGQHLRLAEARSQAGQMKNAVFANPGFSVTKELYPTSAEGFPTAETFNYQDWQWQELHRTDDGFAPLDFADFFADPDGSMGKAADGKPIGLDQAAFRQ